MARGDLLKGTNVCLICERPPAPCKADNLWINFLSEVEGGPTNAEGVAKGRAPAMGFEDGVHVCQSSVPRLSRHENKGSSGPAGTTRDKF